MNAGGGGNVTCFLRIVKEEKELVGRGGEYAALFF